jgi:hypothetical protein
MNLKKLFNAVFLAITVSTMLGLLLFGLLFLFIILSINWPIATLVGYLIILFIGSIVVFTHLFYTDPLFPRD